VVRRAARSKEKGTRIGLRPRRSRCSAISTAATPCTAHPPLTAGERLPQSGRGRCPRAGSLEETFLNDTFRALRHRNYRLFYFGQTISLSGTWMQAIAQAWLVLQITNSKAALGIVTMLQFLPITVFVMFAGVIADRVPKRNFIVGTQTLAMLQAVGLTVLVWSGHIQLWHVYVLALVLGLANAFDQPTRQAFIVEMVGKDDVMNAVALNSGMFNSARLVGPAVGGFVIALVGVKGAFLLNGVSFVPVIVALLMMRTSDLRVVSGIAGPADPLRELREGVSYAFRTPAVLLIVILLAFIGTFGYNFTVVLPLVDRYVLGQGSVGLGFLTAAVGLGALVSALLLANRGRATTLTLFAGALAFSVLLGAVALSRWYLSTVLLLVALGAASTVFAATANTSLQLAAPDRLRGRLMALYMLLFAGSTPIGGFLTGIMAEHLGVSTTVGIEALLCLIGLAVGFRYYFAHRQRISETANPVALGANN
jgi:MFS family permease